MHNDGWCRAPWQGFPGSLSLAHLDEPLEGAVVGLFNLRREATARQFLHAQMVAQTLATETPARAGCIGTATIFEILLKVLTFRRHCAFPFSLECRSSEQLPLKKSVLQQRRTRSTLEQIYT